MSPCPPTSSSAPSTAPATPPSTEPKCKQCSDECGCGQGTAVCPASGSPEISDPHLKAPTWAKFMPQVTRQRRPYSSQLKGSSGTVGDYNFGNGHNWMAEPYFSEDATGAATIVLSPCTSYVFDCVSGSYVARYGAKQTLVADATNHLVKMTDCDGSTLEFNDFAQTAKPQGSFKRYTAPGGEKLEVTSYSSTRITEIRRSPDGGTTIDRYSYAYYSGGAKNNLLQTVTHQRSANGGTT